MLTRRKTLAGANQNNCWTGLELPYFRVIGLWNVIRVVPRGWTARHSPSDEQTGRNPKAKSCRRFVQDAKLNVDALFQNTL